MEPTSTSALAARLGLSRWAVSRALNRRSGVSPETVARVHAASAGAGFTPDPFARALRGARTGVIGVAVPALDQAPALRVAALLQRGLHAQGFQVELCTTGGDPAGEEDALRRFAGRRAEAVLVFASSLGGSSPGFKRLRDKNMPIFLVEPRVDPCLPGVSVARADHQGAMTLIVRHLHGLGHRRLAVVGFGGSDGPDPRGSILRKVCEEHGISWREAVRWWDPAGEVVKSDEDRHPGLLPTQRFSPAGAKDLATALTKGRAGATPTAVIAADDSTALEINRALRLAGRSVPGEFSLVGYGNDPLAECCTPALTTVDLQLAQIAPRIVSLLSEMLQSPGRIEMGTLWANPLLVRRDSTAPPGGHL